MTVRDNSPPTQTKDWVVELEGHCDEVDGFVDFIMGTFKSHGPEIVSEKSGGNDDEIVVTIIMRWDSVGFENWLEIERPDHVSLRQHHTKEGQNYDT